MGKANFSDEFKRDAVRQITDRGYPVSEVSQRLGVSAHSCQSASDKDPLSASNRDPSFGFELVRRSRAGQGCGAVADQRAWFG